MTKEEKIISNLYEAKKIELGTHKVELGISQDLEKELVNIQNLTNPISKNIDRLTNLNKELVTEKKLANDNLIKLNSAYEKAVVLHDKMKALQSSAGIELPIVTTAFNYLKGAEADYNDLKKLINQIK